MAEGKFIEVIIDSKGNVTYETKGFSGTACKDATKALDKALGTKVSDKETAEAIESKTRKQHH